MKRMDGIPVPEDEIRLCICITCRGSAPANEGTRPGARLHDALGEALQAQGGLFAHVRLEPVECLSGCKRGCTIALSAPGRWTYVYGDLDPDASVETILDGLRRYGATTDGLIPWRERPEAFRKGVLARIPPSLSHRT